MTWWDKIFLAFYFFLIMCVQAICQRELIRANRRIRHGWYAVQYLFATGLVCWVFFEWWWQLLLISLSERAALFDLVLNYLRRKNLFYNGAGGSVMDRIENRLGSVWLVALKCSYLLLFILLFIFL